LPVTFLFHEQCSTEIPVAGFQYADAEFRSSIFSLMFYQKILDNIGSKEIPDDHLCLTSAVGIALIG
jgi:hypothetical protein